MNPAQFPEIVYKYCPPDRLEPLVDHTLRITPFDQLNDPWECMPVVESENPERSRQDALFRRFKVEGGRGGPLGSKFKAYLKKFTSTKALWRESLSGEKESLHRLQQSFRFQQRFSKGFGVICLSSKANSTLMWSHYTKDHAGYVVGIRPAKFVELHEKRLARFSEIEYSDERFRVTFEKMGTDDFDDGFLFRKSRDWSYEREWRLASLFSNGVKSKTNPEVTLFNYGAEHLAEIIVGYKADEKLGGAIDAVKARLPRVTVRYACPSTLSFDLQLLDQVPKWLIAAVLKKTPQQ